MDECARCHEPFYIDDSSYEPTKYCHSCAHHRVEELELEVALLRSQVETLQRNNSMLQLALRTAAVTGKPA